MSDRQKTCGCCDGVGLVEAITGEARPCSRCRSTAFHEWYCRPRKQAAETDESKAGGVRT